MMWVFFSAFALTMGICSYINYKFNISDKMRKALRLTKSAHKMLYVIVLIVVMSFVGVLTADLPQILRGVLMGASLAFLLPVGNFRYNE